MAKCHRARITGIIEAAIAVSLFYFFKNSGVILTNVVHYLFGSHGILLLGVAIAAACLTTSVGIVAAFQKQEVVVGK